MDALDSVGLPIGTILSRNLINLYEKNQSIISKQNSILFFLSTYCIHCVDLMPYINEINKKYQLKAYLFSNGNEEDHNEMIEYFAWDFPIIQMEEAEMLEHFNVSILPYFMLINRNNHVVTKGVIYNDSDVDFYMKQV